MFSPLYSCRLLLPALLCLLLSRAVVFAQKPLAGPTAPAVKFGQITPDRFGRQPTDSTAEATIQYTTGAVRFEVASNQIWIVLDQHVRMKINRKSAYERAIVALPVRHRNGNQSEFVSDFDGITYNLVNGSVTTDKLNKTGHFTEKASDTYWIEKYTLPNVREGSIIEYRYTIRTPFSVASSPKTWYFQHDIPVAWSEYRITIPNYFYYKILMGGYLSLAINENNPVTVTLLPGQSNEPAIAYRFVVQDAPAFRDEAYITTDDDYLAKIDFELARYTLDDGIAHNFSVDWSDVDKTLLGDAEFGGQLKRTGFLREVAKTLLSQHTDTLARITAAYNHVRQRVKWNGQANYWSTSVKKVYDDRKGDAGDINLLLIALLREMDLNANPVLLSTRSHGRINETYALLRQFNYVVAHVLVGGKDFFLDATDSQLLPGMLPLHCLNGSGRLVQPDNGRFVSLAPTERDVETQSAQFTLTEDGDLTGSLIHSRGGYSAWAARREFNADGRAKYVEAMQKKRLTWQIEKAEFAGTEPSVDAFRATYTFSIPDACAQAGDRLYLRPMLTEARRENPFKEAGRLYPVDFGVPIDESFIASYTLPAGFKVEELPKAAVVALPDNGGRFVYQIVNTTPDKIQVTSRLLLRRSQYFAEDYTNLREFFNQIVAKHAEQVVLKRTTPTNSK